MSDFQVNHFLTVIQRSNMNVTDKYFFLLLVNSTNKNQKLSLLKSISPSQYKILKEITFKILKEIIVVNTKQLRKLKKHKNLIRKLGYNKVSGQVLAKNCSIVIEIVQIGLEEYEICSKIYPGSKRGMGKNKSASEKCKAVTYSKNRKEYFTSSESSEEFSSQEYSDEENCNEKCNDKKQYQFSSENSTSGEEFAEEYANESTEREEEEESYENSETEGNNTEKDDE